MNYGGSSGVSALPKVIALMLSEFQMEAVITCQWGDVKANDGAVC
jgi:hypothetical protein